jgi:hypothetical protein
MNWFKQIKTMASIRRLNLKSGEAQILFNTLRGTEPRWLEIADWAHGTDRRLFSDNLKSAIHSLRRAMDSPHTAATGIVSVCLSQIALVHVGLIVQFEHRFTCYEWLNKSALTEQQRSDVFALMNVLSWLEIWIENVLRTQTEIARLG